MDTTISGNLTELNFSSATRIPNSIIASPNVEEFLTLDYGLVAAGAVIPAGASGIPVAIKRIQGSGSYTIAGIGYTVTAVTGGGTPGNISLNYGTVSAGAFTSSGTIVASVALPSLSSGQTASGNYTPLITSVSAPTHLAILPTVSGATYSCRLSITFRLIRSLQ